ncbi:MAG TPA: dienelactone hydrolase family protein, partial [Burkholderiales bacterium]|nr:dienelactone hydrolase family protein [Burkholderiales bacterium]
VKQMKLPPLGIRFVFPHAPMRPVTINGGFVMRAWYDIAYQELAFKEDERGLRDSQKLIEDLIARENKRGIPSSRIVLAGFSQGGVITLQAGLRQPKRLAGLMALSAYLPMSPMVEVERNAASNSVPIFMGHGIADDIVPLALAKMSRDTLIKLGYEVEWHQYQMPHSVCPEELADIGAWLKRVLH